ncbi:PREDICTED: DNA mismatch repair protein MutS-like, partial [Papilio xuthus]|uniref:DNA mismatch repair protein MutS-like n=1 Tax=Papilio xuthus TaxID=66420 RepID=A0AAJ7EFR1_PAPXU
KLLYDINSCSPSSLIAMAKVAKEMNFVRPTLTTEKVIRIKQGRHPLYAASCDALVPNDAESSLEAGLVKIITGPNASGKSVYLKQTGLIVYLAHIGSFVPAAAAEIGLLSHIFSRIKSTECVAAHMSAFLIDLRQVHELPLISPARRAKGITILFLWSADGADAARVHDQLSGDNRRVRQGHGGGGRARAARRLPQRAAGARAPLPARAARHALPRHQPLPSRHAAPHLPCQFTSLQLILCTFHGAIPMSIT